MLRQYCEDFTSDSELADSNVDQFEEQSETESGNPIPVSPSDNDEPSPLQNRKERSKAAAYESIDAKSAMEEDEDCEIIEMYEEKAPENFASRRTTRQLSRYRTFIFSFSTWSNLGRMGLCVVVEIPPAPCPPHPCPILKPLPYTVFPWWKKVEVSDLPSPPQFGG